MLASLHARARVEMAAGSGRPRGHGATTEGAERGRTTSTTRRTRRPPSLPRPPLLLWRRRQRERPEQHGRVGGGGESQREAERGEEAVSYPSAGLEQGGRERARLCRLGREEAGSGEERRPATERWRSSRGPRGAAHSGEIEKSRRER